MFKGKPRVLAYVLLAFLVGFTAFAAQEKSKSPALSDNLTLAKKPNITDVKHIWMGEPDVEIEVVGTNFGATRGTKSVRIDGTVVASSYFISWGNTGISFGKPFPFIYWDHVYQFAIVDGSTVLSNVFSKRIPWDLDGIFPKEGPVGTEAEITVYRLSTSPNGFVLKIGTHDFPVTSWTGGVLYGKIKAKVPPGVPLGVQDVYLQKGGEVASEKYQFTVTLPVIHIPTKVIKK